VISVDRRTASAGSCYSATMVRDEPQCPAMISVVWCSMKKIGTIFGWTFSTPVLGGFMPSTRPFSGITGSKVCRLSAAFALVIVSGCAMLSVDNLPSNEEKLFPSTQTEGVVLGSVFLTVEEENSEHSYYGEDYSLLAGIRKGLKTSGRTFAVWAELNSSVWSQHTFAIVAKPGKEELFVKKLPAGTYQIFALSPEGFPPGQSNNYMRLGVTFEVLPRQTTYIGQITIELPYRFGGGFRETGGGSGTGIWDSEVQTIAKLRDKFPHTVSKVANRLAFMTEYGGLISKDCVKVKRALLSRSGEQTDADAAAAQFCSGVGWECSNRPRGEACRKLIESYDLQRYGSGTSLLMEVAGTKGPGENSGSTILMRYYLDIGFSPNARVGGSYSETLMPHIAPGYGRRPSGDNWRDLTPLMIAAGVGDRMMVQMLLRAGANTNIQNDQGQTALSIAELRGHTEIANILKNYSTPK
jgi:Ankyrin repeats (3 copies)